MSAFTYEIANALAAVTRAHPSHPEPTYSVPWYLVIGNPGSGRSAALHAMNLTWGESDGPLNIGLPQQHCTYWMPKEALFIEPEAQVLGPGRQPNLLGELCADLRTARPREPIDGILLVINLADFIDQDENGIEQYANGIRRYTVEIAQHLQTDVPTYVVLTRYDTMWGFAEVFQWTPDRRKEDPWGFTLPPDTPSQSSLERIQQDLEGLNARLESLCLSKLCGEDPPEARIRAFQHLAEVRMLTQKLRIMFGVLSMPNAYERAPWIRAVALGSAVPGTGDKCRAGFERFGNMGLAQGSPAPVSQRPGGLPFHALMTAVILPEKDIVPTRTRWRDDKLILLAAIMAGLLWLATIVTGIVLAATHGSSTPHRPTKSAPKR
jgi:type VI protein secretion system component VasK